MDTVEFEIARYEAYRGQVQHEDHLLGLRLGWLIASEAFLFAAYAHLPNDQNQHLRDLLPVLGVGIAVLVALAIVAAMLALRRLRREYPRGPNGFPPVVSGRTIHSLGLVPLCAIPIALAAAWIYLAV